MTFDDACAPSSGKQCKSRTGTGAVATSILFWVVFYVFNFLGVVVCCCFLFLLLLYFVDFLVVFLVVIIIMS